MIETTKNLWFRGFCSYFVPRVDRWAKRTLKKVSVPLFFSGPPIFGNTERASSVKGYTTAGALFACVRLAWSVIAAWHVEVHTVACAPFSPPPEGPVCFASAPCKSPRYTEGRAVMAARTHQGAGSAHRQWGYFVIDQPVTILITTVRNGGAVRATHKTVCAVVITVAIPICAAVTVAIFPNRAAYITSQSGC